MQDIIHKANSLGLTGSSPWEASQSRKSTVSQVCILLILCNIELLKVMKARCSTDVSDMGV